MNFLSLENSNHVVVSVSNEFSSKPQPDAPSPCIAYEYSRADWDGPCDHLVMFHWRISLKLVLLLLLMNFVSWFRLELMYVFLI